MKLLYLFILLAVAIPPLTGRIVDDAGLLNSTEESQLTSKLQQIEKAQSVQIAIYTVASLEGEPIEDFSIRLAEKWAIGTRKDNGIVIVAVRDERKARIEVGYGLEPVIPDGLAGRIIREQMAPRFRQNDYYGGLSATVDALVLAARKEYPEQEVKQDDEERGVGLSSALIFAFFLWMAISGIFAGGGAWSARFASALIAALLLPGALYVSRVAGFPLLWLFGPIGFVIGFLAAPIVRKGRARGRNRRHDSTWTYPWYIPGSRSGGWSGGGFRGGGGRFGGGGASGSW